MSNAESRLEVLTRINRAISGLKTPTLPAYPQAARLSHEEVLHQFQDRILDYKASFWRVNPGGVPAAVIEALSGAGSVVVPPGLDSAWIPAGLNALRDDPLLSHQGLDQVDAVITGCAVAISETGTIILNHAPDQGRRALSLIPDLHVCIIRAEQIVQTVRQGVHQVQGSIQAGRPLTWISGGSATSDIELIRVEGVHGPRKLCVIVIDGA